LGPFPSHLSAMLMIEHQNALVMPRENPDINVEKSQ
jgi:hypothetical protein